jgi:hypothetical protein
MVVADKSKVEDGINPIYSRCQWHTADSEDKQFCYSHVYLAMGGILTSLQERGEGVLV